MALAAKPRAGAGWALVPGRKASRFGYWLAERWREATAGRGLTRDLRERLALDRGERVLTAARDAAGDCAVVATERALYHRAGGHWRRQGWERVSAVDWDAGRRRLVFTGLADIGLGPLRSAVALRERGCLVELAGERITHTRLGRWPMMLPGGEPAVVEARRLPVTGELLWLVDVDGICWDIRDGTVHASITRAVARLGADLGIAAPLPFAALSRNGAGKR